MFVLLLKVIYCSSTSIEIFQMSIFEWGYTHVGLYMFATERMFSCVCVGVCLCVRTESVLCVPGWDNDHDDSGGADGGQRSWMVTDDTGLSSDGTQTVSDDCTSFPELHPSLSLWGEAQHKGRPRCPLAALKRHLLMETAALPLLFHLAVAPSISIHDDLSRSFSLPSFSRSLSPSPRRVYRGQTMR